MTGATQAVPIEGIVALSIGGREVSARAMVASPVIVRGRTQEMAWFEGGPVHSTYREPDRLRSFRFAWPGWRLTHQERAHLQAGPHSLSMQTRDREGLIEWWYEAVTFRFPDRLGYWAAEYAEFVAGAQETHRAAVKCIGIANYVDGPASHPFMREQDPDAKSTLGGFWRVPPENLRKGLCRFEHAPRG